MCSFFHRVRRHWWLGVGVLLAFALSGCASLERIVHMYSSNAPAPQVFDYPDGGSSIYYTFTTGGASQPQTVVFFYGATGCPSWKSVMPDYVSGLYIPARVFVLNKRFVPDRSSGLFDCGSAFHLANNPEQWVADYTAFITAQVGAMTPKPKRVALVGVSEGAWPAARVAARLPQVTHLAVLGSGGYSMRRSLATLRQRGAIAFDVEAGWEQIAADPRSIEKTWYGNPYRWWSDVMDLDPLPDYLRLEIPTMVGIGERDESVPVESALDLAAKFKAAGKHNLHLHVYPGADHRLNSHGVSHRNEFFAELSRLLQQQP